MKDKNLKINSKFVRKDIYNYFLKYKFRIIAVLFLYILEAVIAILSPKLSGKGITALSAVDAMGNPNVDMNYIFNLLSFLLVFYSVDGLCSCIGKYFFTRMSLRVAYDLRNKISLKINSISFEYLEKRKIGDMLSCIINDVETFGTSFIGGICSAISSLILGIGTLFMMLSISWEITFILFLIFPLMMIVISIVVKISQKYFVSYREKLGEMNVCLEETFSGFETVKALGIEGYLKEKFDVINFSLKQKADDANFFSSLTGPTMSFLSNLFYIICCVAGGYLAVINKMQIGDIVAIIAYSSKIAQPLMNISATVNSLQIAFASSFRIFEILNAPEEVEPCEKIENRCDFINSSIEFKDVSFGYEKNKMVLKNISFKIRSGEIVAIVGETGGGKTTVLELIMRFYKPLSGTIFIGDKNINTIDIKEYRKYFGIVNQDSWLYNSSIMQNIRYGKLNASDEEIIKIIKFLNVETFIESLPEGYETIVKENASNLSEGQKQIICIARAVISDRPILILDEATSSIDTSLESCLQDALMKAFRKKTSIIVAHRLSTIKNADKILLIRNGKLEECGKHEELILKKGAYYEMYSKSFR